LDIQNPKLTMKNNILLIFLLISSFTLQAQTITGRVLTKNGEIAPFATLSLRQKLDSTQVKLTSTDTLGLFQFSGLAPGKYELGVSAVGYQRLLLPIDLTASELKLADIVLIEDLQQLQTVLISGAKPNFSTQDGQMRIQIAGNTFLKSNTNLLDVLKKLPGVLVNPDGSIIMGNRNAPAIFIDGRPNNMGATEIIAYLGNLSPEMVESIDLINQPSSKYDGEYKAIIDIRLKKQRSLGLRGTYSVRLQRNQNTLADHTIGLTYKTNRFMYGLNMSYTTGSYFYRYHALQYLANGLAMTTDTKTITMNNNLMGQARIGYQISKNQELEAFARIYQVRRSAETGNHLLTQSSDLIQTLAQLSSVNLANPRQYNYAAGFTYALKSNPHSLQLQATIAQVDNRQSEDIQNHNSQSSELINYWKTAARNNINIRNAQADYTYEVNNGRLEMGTKFAYTSTANNLRYDTLQLSTFVFDAQRSNQFNYQEYIAAAYLSFSKKWDKVQGSLSLRAEHTHSLANSVTTSAVTERNYLKWLPSLNMTYTISKDHQVNFSFTSRLTRPTFEMLNPFRFYFSPRNYWIGNPYLLPATTRQFALTYSKKAFQFSLTAGREKNPMARYPSYNPITNELIYMGDNLPYRDFASIQATLPVKVTKWWQMSHTASFFYNRELRPYFDHTYQIAIYNHTINGSQVFTIKNWLLDFSYNYESKSGNSLYIFAPVYTLDMGLQKSWLTNKINTKLNLTDIFYNGQRRLIFRDKTIINNDFYHDSGTRRLILSVSYNFGKSTFNAKENKRSEEENRANR
jgi:hypothetical protein